MRARRDVPNVIIMPVEWEFLGAAAISKYVQCISKPVDTVGTSQHEEWSLCAQRPVTIFLCHPRGHIWSVKYCSILYRLQGFQNARGNSRIELPLSFSTISNSLLSGAELRSFSKEYFEPVGKTLPKMRTTPDGTAVDPRPHKRVISTKNTAIGGSN